MDLAIREKSATGIIDLSQSCSGSSRSNSTLLDVFLVEQGIGYLGTGSRLQAFYTDLSGSNVIMASERQSKRVPIKDVQNKILQAFNLSFSELATVCHKSRKALYDWQEGSVPRPNAADRLFRLYRVATDWLDSSEPLSKSRLREPVLSGQSLFDLLTADEIDIEAIAFLRRRVALEIVDEMEIEDPFV